MKSQVSAFISFQTAAKRNLSGRWQSPAGSRRKFRYTISIFLLSICGVILLLGSPLRAQSWTSVSPLLDTRHRHGAATGPDGRVYVVAGVRGLSGLKSMERYDPLTNAWMSMTPMVNQPRAEAAVVFGTDGKIYVIGGIIGNVSTKIVERYNTLTGVWQTVGSLQQRRGHLAAAVGPDGRLYAIGGYDSPSGTSAMNSVEVYDPGSGQWNPAPPMNKPRQNHRALTGLDGNIYVFGDSDDWEKFDGNTWTLGSTLSDIQGFDATTGPDGVMYWLGVNPSVFWGSKQAVAYGSNDPSSAPLAVPNLLQSRMGAAATVAEGKILVTGGYRKASPGELTFVEAYGPLKSPSFSPDAKGWWRFNEPNGPTVMDATGNNNVGTVVGNAVHGPGRIVDALLFNGVSQYVRVNDAPSVNFGSSNLTIEGWVKWTSTGSGVTPILDKRVQVAGKFRGYHLFIYTGGKLGLQLANGTTYQNYVATNTSIQPNQWTHIAVTVDRTSLVKTVKLYVNSVHDRTFGPLMGDLTNNAFLNIGRHGFQSTYFKGAMDELTLYNRALRWAEIRAVFLAGKEGKL